VDLLDHINVLICTLGLWVEGEKALSTHRHPHPSRGPSPSASMHARSVKLRTWLEAECMKREVVAGKSNNCQIFVAGRGGGVQSARGGAETSSQILEP